MTGTTHSDLACWRQNEAKKLCSGKRVDTRGLVLAIPNLLILSVCETQESGSWDFPESLIPLTKKLASKVGLIYDLVGFGLHSPVASHFKAQYVLQSHSAVFCYDGMENNGYTMQAHPDPKSSTLDSHSKELFPPGYNPLTAVYHLRGSSMAQDTFFKARQNEFLKRFQLEPELPKCSYTGDLVELSQNKRHWIKKPSLRKRTIEYISPVARPKPLVQEPTSLPVPPPANDSPESEEPTFNPRNSPTVSQLDSLPNLIWLINC